MLTIIADLIAPHYCCLCGTIGCLLCEHCKQNITDEIMYRCPDCGNPNVSGQCQSCHLPYQAAWCALERNTGIKRLINQYKFNHVQLAQYTLAELLDIIAPQLPQNTVVVPVPTISAHIRQRGYDHCLLLAKRFAQRRNLVCSSLIKRQSSSVQLGSNRYQRTKQAQHAFVCPYELLDLPYCIIDDITTTGATVKAAAQSLRQAGAKTIFVAVVAYQP